MRDAVMFRITSPLDDTSLSARTVGLLYPISVFSCQHDSCESHGGGGD
jgi:hypothetical protein